MFIVTTHGIPLSNRITSGQAYLPKGTATARAHKGATVVPLKLWRSEWIQRPRKAATIVAACETPALRRRGEKNGRGRGHEFLWDTPGITCAWLSARWHGLSSTWSAPIFPWFSPYSPSPSAAACTWLRNDWSPLPSSHQYQKYLL